MSTNLFIIRHGKINTDESNKREYLHLSPEGKTFSSYLDHHFKDIYFDHVFYQSTDIKTSDPYNRCRNTIQGLKGKKSEFDNTHLSKAFEELNDSGGEVQNVLLCFRAEGYNVICNILNSPQEEQFNKEYHRIFHFKFDSNNYSFVDKLTVEDSLLAS